MFEALERSSIMPVSIGIGFDRRSHRTIMMGSGVIKNVALMTPTYRGDLERFELLCESVDRFVSGFERHYVIVNDDDLPFFARFENGRRIVLPSFTLPAVLAQGTAAVRVAQGTPDDGGRSARVRCTAGTSSSCSRFPASCSCPISASASSIPTTSSFGRSTSRPMPAPIPSRSTSSARRSSPKRRCMRFGSGTPIACSAAARLHFPPTITSAMVWYGTSRRCAT